MTDRGITMAPAAASSPPSAARSRRARVITVVPAALPPIAACLAVATAVASRDVAALLAALALVPAAAAAEVDRTRGRLPDPIVAAVAGVAVFACGVGVAPVTTLLAGAAVAGLPVLALHLAAPATMGFGDVKLAAALGAGLAVADWRAALVLLMFGSGCALAGAALTRRRSLPFGPGLVTGGALALITVLAVTKGTL